MSPHPPSALDSNASTQPPSLFYDNTQAACRADRQQRMSTCGGRGTTEGKAAIM